MAAALLASACAEAFEPPPDGGPATVAPPAAAPETPSPAPTPEPSPVEIAVSKLPTDGDDFLPVKVLGWIQTGGSVFCGSETCKINFIDPANPRESVTIEVATDADGAPGTMQALGSGYSESELVLVPDSGAVMYAGDYAWVTGSWDPSRRTLYPDRIERAVAPKLKTTTSTIAQLRTRKPGTLVKVTGRLDTPFLLSCWSGTCNLYLQDLKDSSRTVKIEVLLGPETGARPNTMRPLGDDFTNSQLRVFDAKKKVCRYGERVAVVGWVYRDEDGKAYIDPVRTITRIGP
jgi:hypothetical protein